MMKSREFAIHVVQRLQDAGHQAFWAGGCVRDFELGRTPKDYDVATGALPDQVRDLFGKRRSLAIGAAFGVITVLGPRGATSIEVATFRRDGGYSDGRRPDHVEYSSDREDARRRDFTVNGMFYDPIAEEVIDYVGGRDDLRDKLVRAIGNPHERIAEDKLRMLRGVRFSATLGFELESETMAAIQDNASDIHVVSGERIGNEMRRMLACPRRSTAVKLLRESRLMPEILDQGASLYESDADWNAILNRLDRLQTERFESSAAVLLESIVVRNGMGNVFERWKLSTAEKKTIEWICNNWRTLDRAAELKWSEIQPLLLHPGVRLGLDVAASQNATASDSVAFCNERLGWPEEELNPRPWLDGTDLIKFGIPHGPQFSLILAEIRNRQLDGEIESVEQALDWVRQREKSRRE